MLNAQKGEHAEPEENAAEEKIPEREKQDSDEKEFFPNTERYTYKVFLPHEHEQHRPRRNRPKSNMRINPRCVGTKKKPRFVNWPQIMASPSFLAFPARGLHDGVHINAGEESGAGGS
jgi:hypothetical protein